MKLDCKEHKQDDKTSVYEAEYETYNTPVGTTGAIAKVYPDEHFPNTIRYETRLYDPFLQELGHCCSEKFAYGVKIGGNRQENIKSAMETCEDCGYQIAADNPFCSHGHYDSLWDVNAVKDAVKWYTHERGIKILYMLGTKRRNNRYETEIRVRNEQEYCIWTVRMDDKFNFDII